MKSAQQWLSRLNSEQLLWADNYMRERGVVLGERRGDYADLANCIAFILNTPAGRELVQKMRNAAAQKKFRENRPDKRAHNITIRNDVKAQLNRLAKKSNLSISAKLEDLITGAHTRELAHLKEMKKLKERMERNFKEMAENERQAKLAAMRVQERLNTTLKELSERIAHSTGLEGDGLETKTAAIYKHLLQKNEDVYFKLTRSKTNSNT